jgi:hypothetical protein
MSLRLMKTLQKRLSLNLKRRKMLLMSLQKVRNQLRSLQMTNQLNQLKKNRRRTNQQRTNQQKAWPLNQQEMHKLKISQQPETSLQR